jgi:hypothetical protein
MSNSAIYFHPDGYVTNRADLKGRHVAGESFLTGFLRHAGSAELVCCAEDEELAAGFYELAQRHAPGRPVRLVTQDRLERLSEPGCLFIPGANIEQFAWSRRRVGQRTYSLCGVTHTTAENPSLCGGLLTGPIQPWDAPANRRGRASRRFCCPMPIICGIALARPGCRCRGCR